MRYQALFILLSLLLIISSCKTTRNLSDTNYSGKMTKEVALQKIKENAIDFKYLNANLNIDVDSEPFTGSLNGKLRVIKDSVIWMSFSKFGFEGARVMLTKDSIFMVERIQKTFVRKSLSEASEDVEFELSYNMFQDFLIGQPFLEAELISINPVAKDSLLILPQIDNFIIAHLFELSNFNIVKSNYESIRDGIKAELSYGEYEQIDEGKNFSYFRTFIFEDEDGPQAEGSVKFIKPELNIEKSINFSIPDHYTERDL